MKRLIALLLLQLSFMASALGQGQAKQCDSGAQACLDAPSISTDDHGNIRCCQAGYGIALYTSNINGDIVQKCSCSPLNQGGGTVFNSGFDHFAFHNHFGFHNLFKRFGFL